MLIEQVKKLTPLNRLIYWIGERESIRLKKEAGKPKPWTNDEILQSYRFTNVLRIQDKVSQWLLHNWYEPFKDHPNMLLACTLARQLNNIDSMAAVGFPNIWNPKKVQAVLDERKAAGLGNYSAAYMITGGYGEKGRAKEEKSYQTVYRVCEPVYKSKTKIDTNSMERTWKSLLVFPGFSSFIAGQVTADLRWGLTGSWDDKCLWAPMGPGSLRGINRILGRPIEYKLTQAEFMRDFSSLYNKIKTVSGIPNLEAIDFQGTFCEIDKYSRALEGIGRPKVKYKGI